MQRRCARVAAVAVPRLRPASDAADAALEKDARSPPPPPPPWSTLLINSVRRSTAFPPSTVPKLSELTAPPELVTAAAARERRSPPRCKPASAGASLLELLAAVSLSSAGEAQQGREPHRLTTPSRRRVSPATASASAASARGGARGLPRLLAAELMSALLHKNPRGDRRRALRQNAGAVTAALRIDRTARRRRCSRSHRAHARVRRRSSPPTSRGHHSVAHRRPRAD